MSEARIPETAMQTWTPGPWFIGDAYCDDEGHPEIPIHAANGRGGECTPASVVLQFPTVEGMQEANAHLIAAAPELYEALVDAIGIMPPEACGPALAALAKARGAP